MSSGVNWPGLLKWSIDYHDGTSDSVAKPMSPEKREFLEAALKEYIGNIKDHNKACQEALEQIDRNNVDESMSALQLIRDITVENPEMARQFHKLGAAKKLMECLDIKTDYALPVVVLALRILGDVSQNNPELQTSLVELNAIRKLCEVLKDSSESIIKLRAAIKKCTVEEDKVDLEVLLNLQTDKRSRAMSCVSNITRNNRRAEEQFAKQGGLTWIKFALQQREVKFMETSLLLLAHLLAEGTIEAKTLLIGDRPDRKNTSCLFSVLMHKMTTHSLSAGPNLGELFTQTFISLWNNGGNKLPKDNVQQMVDSIQLKMMNINCKVEADRAAAAEGDYVEDFSEEKQMLGALLVQIKSETGITASD
eukprot:GHVH01001123.1.p1 GENE.GHVH01001123.1~~GHVH01001123.1.p1  ORF type:complete len:365 (-),score=67.63 GHVH01001123.1:1103-2197(-)